MENKPLKVSVVMPALNEADNIEAAMRGVLRAFGEAGLDGELLVVNDGSSDATPELVRKAAESDARVRLLSHDRPRGIGASFWDGVDAAGGEAVVMLPGDNENDAGEIFRYSGLLSHVDVVVPFLYNAGSRPPLRAALSYAYRLIINTSFMVFFNYTNGTVLYRRSVLKTLAQRSTGFFFQTDILVRLAKAGYLIAEVPYRLGNRAGGASKAVSLKALRGVVGGYLKLLAQHYLGGGARADYPEDSQTFKRRGQ